MDKKPEIGNNSEYKNKFVSLLGKSQKPTNKKAIEKSESPEQANAPSPLETAHTIKKRMAKSAGKIARNATKAVCTFAEHTAPVISGATEKVSEVKDTLVDRIRLVENPKGPPPEGVTGFTQPNWEVLILEEIESKSIYFSSLLNLTDALIASEPFSQEDAEQLVQKWEYAFTIGECAGLSHELTQLRHDKDVKMHLTGIMQLFQRLGVKKLDVQDPIAVSPENRFYFDNGTQFPDGTVCKIARWPWVYKENVYYRGMLYQTENEQVLL